METNGMSDKAPFSLSLALILGVLAVSTSAILVKLASAPAPIIAFYRLFITILLMSPFVLFKYWKELSSVRIKDLFYSSLAGVFLALHFILWFESLNYTSVASSVVLVTLQPLFSFLGGYIFYKEHLSWKSIAAGFLAIFGSFIIGWGDFQIGGLALWGDILALLGAGMVTGYLLFGQGLRKRLSLAVYTYIVYGTSTCSLFVYSLALNYSFLSYPPNDWLMFLLLALIPTLLGHTVFNWLIKWVNATRISIVMLGEPVGASILAYYILGETITYSQLAGGSIIIIGVYLFMKVNSQDSTISKN
jgi:drug/metabolite transporter (DMT)-like permease